MRYVFSGLLSLVCMSGLVLAQNPPARQTGQTQPGQQGQAQQGQQGQQGQGQQGQPGQQNQFQQGQQGQLQPGQQVQPGQQLQPGQRQQFAGQQGNAQHSGSADQQIAAVVSGCAENEIEISKMAQSKAQSQEVKQFAEQMVRDHSPGYQEMRQLAGSMAGGQGAGHAANPNAAGAAAGGLDWVRVHHEVGRQCLASLKEELGSKEGKEFDHCYMGQQIAAHMKVVDELKVLRNYASQDLRQKLDHELETAKTHLEKAKQIEEGLAGRSADRVSRKPE